MNITSSNVKGFASLFNNKVTTINRNSVSGIIKSENSNFGINRFKGEPLPDKIVFEKTDEMKEFDKAFGKYYNGFREIMTDEDGNSKPIGIDEILKKHDEFTKGIENSEDDEKTKEIKLSALKDAFSFSFMNYTSQTYIESSKFVPNEEGKVENITPYEKQLRRTRQQVSKSNLIDIVNDYLKNGISTLNNNKKVDKYNIFVKESYTNDPSKYDDEIESFDKEDYKLKSKEFYSKFGLTSGRDEVANKYGAMKTGVVESDSGLKTVKTPSEEDSSNTINTYI